MIIQSAMKINKLNYEAYAIDYLEGTLSAEDRKTFDAFIKQYPEVKQELNDYLEAPMLEDVGSERFEEKELVRRNDTDGMRKGLLLLGLLLVGVFVTGIFIGINTKNKSTVEEKKTTVKKETEMRPVSREKSKAVVPTYIAAEESSDGKADKRNEKNVESAVEVEENIWASTASAKKAIEESTPTSELKSNRVAEMKLKQNLEEPIDIRVIATISKEVESIFLSEEEPAQKKDRRPLKLIARLSSREAGSVATELATRQGSVTERLVPNMERDVAYEETYPTVIKKSRWLKILTPQAYKNIELENTLAISNLKSAVTEIEEAIVPEILITK